MKKIILLLGLAILAQTKVLAQSYIFTKSTGTYTDINTGSVLSNNGWDEDSYILPIGFTFNYGGVNYTSVMVDDNGILIFDTLNSVFMVPYLADLAERQTGMASDITYLLSGSPGSRVLKIQWRNAGFFGADPSDFVNFQVWLHEGSNKIDTHFGMVSIVNPSDVFFLGPVHGLILSYDTTNDTFSGPFLSNDPLNPTVVNHVNASLPATLNSYPTDGLIYSFSRIVSGISNSKPVLQVKPYPNPVTDLLYLDKIEDLKAKEITVKVYNTIGELVLSKVYTNTEKLQLNLNTLKAGTYLLEITAGDKKASKPVVKL